MRAESPVRVAPSRGYTPKILEKNRAKLIDLKAFIASNGYPNKRAVDPETHTLGLLVETVRKAFKTEGRDHPLVALALSIIPDFVMDGAQ